MIACLHVRQVQRRSPDGSAVHEYGGAGGPRLDEKRTRLRGWLYTPLRRGRPCLRRGRCTRLRRDRSCLRQLTYARLRRDRSCLRRLTYARLRRDRGLRQRNRERLRRPRRRENDSPLGGCVPVAHDAKPVFAAPQIRHGGRRGPSIAAVDEHACASRCRLHDNAAAEGHDWRFLWREPCHASSLRRRRGLGTDRCSR